MFTKMVNSVLFFHRSRFRSLIFLFCCLLPHSINNENWTVFALHSLHGVASRFFIADSFFPFLPSASVTQLRTSFSFVLAPSLVCRCSIREESHRCSIIAPLERNHVATPSSCSNLEEEEEEREKADREEE